MIGISLDHRYLGLFGDHIVPAIMYRYTQELLRPDLVDAKGKPLIKNATLLHQRYPMILGYRIIYHAFYVISYVIPG